MVYTAYPLPFGNGFSSTLTVNLDYLPSTGAKEVQMFARIASKTLGNYWPVVKSLIIFIDCHARLLEWARDSGSLF